MLARPTHPVCERPTSRPQAAVRHEMELICLPTAIPVDNVICHSVQAQYLTRSLLLMARALSQQLPTQSPQPSLVKDGTPLIKHGGKNHYPVEQQYRLGCSLHLHFECRADADCGHELHVCSVDQRNGTNTSDGGRHLHGALHHRRAELYSKRPLLTI